MNVYFIVIKLIFYWTLDFYTIFGSDIEEFLSTCIKGNINDYAFKVGITLFCSKLHLITKRGLLWRLHIML